MGERNAWNVLSLTSTGPGICNFTCAIKSGEIFRRTHSTQVATIHGTSKRGSNCLRTLERRHAEFSLFLQRGENSPKQSRLEPLDLPSACLWSGWNGPLARSVGRLARQPSAFLITGSQNVRAQDSAASCRRGRPSWPFHPINLLEPTPCYSHCTPRVRFMERAG